MHFIYCMKPSLGTHRHQVRVWKMKLHKRVQKNLKASQLQVCIISCYYKHVSLVYRKQRKKELNYLC